MVQRINIINEFCFLDPKRQRENCAEVKESKRVRANLDFVRVKMRESRDSLVVQK